MFKLARTLLWLSLTAGALHVTASAQQLFELPNARVGENYRVEISQVLRDTYRLRLKTENQNAAVQWALASGSLPQGLNVRADGFIVGKPSDVADKTYVFRASATDAAAQNDVLVLEFALKLNGGGLRLVSFQGPTLTPLDAASNSTTDSGREKPGRDVGSDNNSNQTTGGTDTNTAEDSKVANENTVQDPLSSMNKRFIVGFEQTGAASTESQSRPFFDLFINTPITKATITERARFSIWGDVRLTSTPEQVKAFGDVSANPVASITGGKLNQLALSFDFVVGPEIKISDFGHTNVSFIGAFGAVSPLSPKQSAQIFQVPDPASSQADTFFKQYPGAKGRQFIGFITPDRDRFLRQYFGGLRFKTYAYKAATRDKDGRIIKDEQPEDYFPAMLDVTFGQSEAVTGGRLHKFVVGIDGFYPLPFKDNDKRKFLYLFGSAKFKAGGPKTITTPFILDTAASSISITDPKVFIADPTQSNRDVFRIGLGVDLIELFKH